MADEETTLAAASTIELACSLAERPAIAYQEIAMAQGLQNIVEAQAQQTSDGALEEPAPRPHCLPCDRTDQLHEIKDVGHLCFSCLQHNSGAELERLAYN